MGIVFKRSLLGLGRKRRRRRLRREDFGGARRDWEDFVGRLSGPPSLSVCLSACNKELSSDEACRARLFLTLPLQSIRLFRVNEMRRSATKAANKELERIDAVFNSYANASSGLIDPEGIERLCSDLEVDHTDVRVLMLAWKMKAEKQGYFTLEEWRVGLKALRVDNVSKLKKALPELEKEVRRPSNFVDFYSYAFRYCLTEEKQKSIDIDSICELLNIVLGSQYHSQVDLFTQYLKIQNDYKVINMDQWMGFYRFCDEISFPDLSNYNPELAWPLILDNFVEWIREKQSQS